MQQKTWDKESIQALLKRNDQAVARAVLAIYKAQTHSEQNAGITIVRNNVGFNQPDSHFLSSIADQLSRGRTLSERQMIVARRKIMKYWHQLMVIANG